MDLNGFSKNILLKRSAFGILLEVVEIVVPSSGLVKTVYIIISSIDCFISFQPSNSICKVFDEDNSSVRESSNDRPMRKKEAIRSREKNFQSIRSVEENYLHSCFAHTGEALFSTVSGSNWTCSVILLKELIHIALTVNTRKATQLSRTQTSLTNAIIKPTLSILNILGRTIFVRFVQLETVIVSSLPKQSEMS
ncbi:hypothetical protein CFP56_040304 [Quercus suber]|uniref:Uncharacterized protein n=1 Tax=Quercus suber TaxID=58331 RepID=A0AAW0LLQ3_QUESU